MTTATFSRGTIMACLGSQLTLVKPIPLLLGCYNALRELKRLQTMPKTRINQMAEGTGERDIRYKKGFLAGYTHALINIEHGASVEELRKFMADELNPWAEDASSANRFAPSPGFKPK